MQFVLLLNACVQGDQRKAACFSPGLDQRIGVRSGITEAFGCHDCRGNEPKVWRGHFPHAGTHDFPKLALAIVQIRGLDSDAKVDPLVSRSESLTGWISCRAAMGWNGGLGDLADMTGGVRESGTGTGGDKMPQDREIMWRSKGTIQYSRSSIIEHKDKVPCSRGQQNTSQQTEEQRRQSFKVGSFYQVAHLWYESS